MTTPSPPVRRMVMRRWRLVVLITAVIAVVALGIIVTVRQGPLELDAEWMEEVIEHRHPAWLIPSLVMNSLGGGILGALVIPLLTTIALAVFGRRWGALYFLAASIVSAVLVQLLKAVLGRARPDDMLVAADAGSFPSGHVANAATLTVALAFLVGRAWAWYAGLAWVILMALSRTYLGVHWVTDTIGGAVLGAAVALALWAPFATKLGTESWRVPWRPGSVEP
jgi:membrane-associated phospholipid phosphatase